jgi:hypothetical protein
LVFFQNLGRAGRRLVQLKVEPDGPVGGPVCPQRGFPDRS